MGGRQIARPISTKNSITQKNVDISMSPAGFKHTILPFERSKTIRTLDARPLGLAIINIYIYVDLSEHQDRNTDGRIILKWILEK